MRTAPFRIFIIDVSTRIVKHRKALQSVDFYGILICRKGAVLQVQRSCFPSWGHRRVVPLEEVQFFVALRGYECFLYMSYSRRYSVMEIWNNVLALLTLLVTVIIGTAKITWTLAQAIFRDSHRAKHDSKK